MAGSMQYSLLHYDNASIKSFMKFQFFSKKGTPIGVGATFSDTHGI